MLRTISADLIRTRRYWLFRISLVVLLVALALQVNGKIDELSQLELQLEAPPSTADLTLFEELELENNRRQVMQLRQDLAYPNFIGYATTLSTGLGWFVAILLTAVSVGEVFSRHTLRAILSRGVGRSQLLLGHCLSLWLTMGLGVATIAILAGFAGPLVHSQVSDAPISLLGLPDALLTALRVWITYLPFIAATAFWVMLGKSAGPALGIGLGLHFMETILQLLVPPMLIVFSASEMGAQALIRWVGNLLAVMLGYNASIVLDWGIPASIIQSISDAMIGNGEDIMLPTDPWRAAAILAAYTILPLLLALRRLHRYDITYDSQGG